MQRGLTSVRLAQEEEIELTPRGEFLKTFVAGRRPGDLAHRHIGAGRIRTAQELIAPARLRIPAEADGLARADSGADAETPRFGATPALLTDEVPERLVVGQRLARRGKLGARGA